MKNIHFILLMLLLIISCGLINKVRENKGNFETQIDTKKQTPEKVLRDRLSELQNKGLDFLKKRSFERK